MLVAQPVSVEDPMGPFPGFETRNRTERSSRDLWHAVEMHLLDASEGEAVQLMTPLGRALIRAYQRVHPLSRRVSEEILLSHFHLLILTLLRRAQAGEGYRAAQGSFTVWATEHFRRRLGELVAQEIHNVRRSFKTDQRRNHHAHTEDAFGYRRFDGAMELPDPGSAWFWARLETRMDVERVLSHLPLSDRRFLSPLVDGQAETGRDLARHWGVSAAAVSKRFSRIRRVSVGEV